MVKYKAVAKISDGEKSWDVVIYSNYKTPEEAQAGIVTFATHGYKIINAWIEACQ